MISMNALVVFKHSIQKERVKLIKNAHDSSTKRLDH
jgi:hypothetical protein